MYKKLFIMLLAAILLLGVFGTSQAALQAVGPVSPATGYFPVWYQDTTRQLELCLSLTTSPDPAAGGGLMCTLLLAPGFDPALPVSFPLNFPDESFWFTADASIVDAAAGVDVRYVSSLEAAFSTGFVNDGDQISFARIRFYVQVPRPGTYIFTHPFGVDTFVVTTIDSVMREIQFTRDIGVANGIFTGALTGDIGPFLVRSNAPGGAPTPIVIGAETFLGDPNVTQFVTGSRFGTNYLRIQGPGIDITTNQFSISGKVFGGALPPPLAFDRTTYSRTAAGGTKVEVFATSAPGTTVSFRETLAAGVETPMTSDAVTGRAYAQYAPAALPLNLVATATQAGAPPTVLSSPVVDLIKITKAAYSFTTKELTIEAASSDQLPVPTLTALGWGTLSVPPTGGLMQTLVVPNVLEPPARVTVLSSAGGSDTEPVVVPLINIPPIAVNDAATTNQGTAAIINVLANDSDPNQNLPLAVSAASLTQPASGTAAINADQTITYTPNPGFTGTDSFTYKAVDTLGGISNVATVTVTVNAIPVANPDTATTQRDAAVTIDVLINDTDADGTLNPASVAIATAALNGTTSVNTTTGAITYTPNAGFTGTNTFTYAVQDNLGAVSNAATVTITVNAPPAAVNDVADAVAGTPVIINVLVNDTDADGTINPATLAVATAPASGTAVVAAGAITYTANAGFSGTDSFTYTVQDNLGGLSNAATVAVTVTAPVNAPPVAANDGATTNRGVAVVINVLANDTDADGTINPATLTVATAPVSGTAAVSAGAIIYTPNAGFTGTDSFTYTVQDNLAALSNAATVTVTVNNAPPVAASDAATTIQGAPVVINVLANDTDADGTINPATLTVATTPVSGTAAVAAGAITYTSNAGFSGTDSFTYTIRDDLGAISNAATVTITVRVNTPPAAAPDAAATIQGTAATISVLANDSDPDGQLPLRVTNLTQPVASTGSVALNADQTITYTPAANFRGRATFTYRTMDGLGAISNAATVSVTVNPANARVYAISGTITANGAPLAGVSVALSGRATGRVTTNAAGNYTFSRLAVGNYTITPARIGFSFTPAGSSVILGAANLPGQNFAAIQAVGPTGSISGTVTDARTRQPIAGVTVTLAGPANATAVTGINGSFSFTGLLDGSYTVTPSVAGYVLSPQTGRAKIARGTARTMNFRGRVR